MGSMDVVASKMIIHRLGNVASHMEYMDYMKYIDGIS